LGVTAHLEEENIAFAPVQQLGTLSGAKIQEDPGIGGPALAASVDCCRRTGERIECRSPTELAFLPTHGFSIQPSLDGASAHFAQMQVGFLLSVHVVDELACRFTLATFLTKRHTCFELTIWLTDAAPVISTLEQRLSSRHSVQPAC
jgi:hypothetical protein